MNDFEKGFSVTRKKSKKKIPCYTVIEKKTPECCPYCHSENIRPEKGNKTVSRSVYAVINDDFAYCTLLRYPYYCKECEGNFLNTEVLHAYTKDNDFTVNFIEKALELWLEPKCDEKGKGDPSLSNVSSEIGIGKSTLSDWNVSLVQSVPQILPEIRGRKVVFASFRDKDRIRRGFISQQNENGWALIAFLDDYSSAWIDDYLGEVYPYGDFNHVSEVYYDFAPGLGSVLTGYFKNSRVCLNLDNLYQIVCRCLDDFSKDDAYEFRTELRQAMTVPKDDTWARMEVPCRIKGKIKLIPKEYHSQFSGLLDDDKDDEFIMNALDPRSHQPSTERWRNRIRKLVSYQHCYETILVKLLYDNPEYRQRILETGVKVTSETFGRPFSFMTARKYY